jgi:hypothetical protein
MQLSSMRMRTVVANKISIPASNFVDRFSATKEKRKE